MIILNEEKLNTIREKLNNVKSAKAKYIILITGDKDSNKSVESKIIDEIINNKKDLEKYYKSIGLDFTTYNNNCNSAIDYYDRLNDMVEYNVYNNIYIYDLNSINEVYTFFKDTTNVMYISNLLIRYLNKEDKVNWFKNHLVHHQNDIKFIDENILISSVDLSKTLQRL